MTTSDSVPHILRQPGQAEIDAGLEREIETARLATLCTSDPEFQRAGADAMKRLISRRSSEQIARMEHERGLR